MEYTYGATGLCFSIPHVIMFVIIFLVIFPSFLTAVYHKEVLVDYLHLFTPDVGIGKRRPEYICTSYLLSSMCLILTYLEHALEWYIHV